MISDCSAITGLFQNRVNHLTHLVRQTFCLVNQLGISHIQRPRDFKLSLQFEIRSTRKTKKLPELTGA